MELHLHSHRWTQRLPDWTAAAVSGFAAGAVLMVLELLWTTLVSNKNPWANSHMIAAILMGPEAFRSPGFELGVAAVALITHYALGVIFGMCLAALIAPYQLDSSIGMALVVGAVFGLVLYLINFYGMSQVFPWIDSMRGWATVAAHLVFGMTAATLYRKLKRSV